MRAVCNVLSQLYMVCAGCRRMSRVTIRYFSALFDLLHDTHTHREEGLANTENQNREQSAKKPATPFAAHRNRFSGNQSYSNHMLYDQYTQCIGERFVKNTFRRQTLRLSWKPLFHIAHSVTRTTASVHLQDGQNHSHGRAHLATATLSMRLHSVLPKR